MESDGFGLAQIKRQGMCCSVDDPTIPSWNGFTKEKGKYLKGAYPRFWQRSKREAARIAWDMALKTNAKEGAKNGK